VSLLFTQFRGELAKLCSRKRTWLAFGIFGVIELIMPALFLLPKISASFQSLIESRGQSFDEYFSGLTLALLTMRTTVFFVATLFLAMVAGEIVAKEAEDGAIRMLLCRPVKRFRLLVLRYCAAALYTIALVWFIGLVALGAGLVYAGSGGFFAFGFQDHVSTFHSFHDGLIRFLTALSLLPLSLLTVTSLGFMCSCFDIKPAAAVVATLSVFFIDLAFRGVPFFESIHSWFITNRMGAWMQVFQPQIAWSQIAEDYTFLLALDASFFVAGWLAFELRDMKA
jgi:ABC-2 type transport system permease protein